MPDPIPFPTTLTLHSRVRVVSEVGEMHGTLTEVQGMNGDRTATVEVDMGDGSAVLWIGPWRHLRAEKNDG